MDQCYSVVSANVVREKFDQEVVIVHLETGNYYSLDGLAGELWTLLEAGATESQMTRTLTNQYETDEATASQDLQQFLSQLVEEKLVSSSDPLAVDFPAPLSSTKRPYEKPQLSKFTDMQDLLLLDPIHDVDESGWPLRANGQV